MTAGSDILDAVEAHLARFIAYPDGHAVVAHALWCAHTHRMDAFETTPRIAFLSPEPGSGKTRALEVTASLVPRPVEAVNATPAYLFRKVADPEGAPTICFDEVDTVFGPRAKEHEELRGLLNAGHRRGQTAGRCVVRGKEVFAEEWPAYCAVALAGLGNLPDTILTRSIIIAMRRRAPSEIVEPYRRRIHEPEGNVLRDQLADWLRGVPLGTFPALPVEITDRAADCWEPLVAIADAAGGRWPDLARVTGVTHVTRNRVGRESLGVKLLGDVRAAFGDQRMLPTVELLSNLHSLDESVWADLRGKPLDARGLANLLRQYGVSSKPIRIGPLVAKGYAVEDFHDAWVRYLSPLPKEPVTSVTSDTDGFAFARDETGDGEWKAEDGIELPVVLS